MSLENTPQSNRLHIAIFGKRNSGKSSIINSITGFNTSLVSDTPGTTTDLVYKSIEINGIGPCVLIDTAGFDDSGDLGSLRVEKTKLAMEKTDIALIICTDSDISQELSWYNEFKEKKTPSIFVINKSDILSNIQEIQEKIYVETKQKAIIISAKNNTNIDLIIQEIIRNLPENFDSKTITGNLVSEQDTVLLVMPQDIQAPKGRLILPQVQTIRELLDKNCIISCCKPEQLELTLKNLSNPPKLIITDSQVFKFVYERKPQQSMLTSFSVLFAGYKGDISYFTSSVRVMDRLNQNSNILIAEACTHAPLQEDIGRVKIPNMLRKKYGDSINIDIVNGTDFPNDLSKYDLIIHCGSCMFNRKYVMSRVSQAKSQNIPMSNYGIVIAYLTGILENIDIPEN